MRKLLVVLVCSLALFCGQQRKPAQPQWHPLVAVLLRRPIDDDFLWRGKRFKWPALAPLARWLHARGWKDDFLWSIEQGSPFFRALEDLARQQGMDPREYIVYDTGEPARAGRASAILNQGRAVEIPTDRGRFVVAILGTLCVSIPGVMAHQVVLIDQQGQILDEVGCGINSRYGALATDVKNPPEGDGAQLVIRFVSNYGPRSTWHNWHTLTYQGQAYTFREDEHDEPSVWDTNGLCRIGVRKGKFVVLFPRLEKADGEVLRRGGP
jgi:hypothetical protein